MSENAIDSENTSKPAPDTAMPKGERKPTKKARAAKKARRAKKPAGRPLALAFDQLQDNSMWLNPRTAPNMSAPVPLVLMKPLAVSNVRGGTKSAEDPISTFALTACRLSLYFSDKG
ncbi:MAG TPA: hypothetical protein VKS79_25155 [Gemmataceae bacterium]|nr:hypothetical protein [Gemmataceae bacterium]